MPTRLVDLDFDNAAVSISSRSAIMKMAWAATKQEAFTVDVNTISFGVEIECYMPAYMLADMSCVRGGYHNGNPVGITLDPNSLGWKCEQDGSLDNVRHDAAGNELLGCEFVSPALYGIAGYAEVERFMKLIERRGATVTRRCGIHVNIGLESIIGVRDLSRANHSHSAGNRVRNFLRRLLHFVSIHENGMMQIGGRRSRVNNTYCRTVKDWQDDVSKDMPVHEFWNIISRHGRYVTCNLNNVQGDATRARIEFRVFGGTVNSLKVLGYIAVAMGLVHKAAVAPIAPKLAKNAYRLTELLADTKAALRLHVGLWTRHAEVKYGLPSGVWEKWGKRILKNQRWNAKQFINGNSTDNVPSDDNPVSRAH